MSTVGKRPRDSRGSEVGRKVSTVHTSVFKSKQNKRDFKNWLCKAKASPYNLGSLAGSNDQDLELRSLIGGNVLEWLV